MWRRGVVTFLSRTAVPQALEFAGPELRTSCTSLRGWTPTPSTERRYATSPRPRHGHDGDLDPNAPTIAVTFVEKDGNERTVRAPIGKDLLTLAHDHEIDLEGACEGSLACSTCHIIVEDQKLFDSLPEPEDDENDMLDLAFGLTETSRLGCQIKATAELDGLRVRIPSASRNIGKEVA